MTAELKTVLTIAGFDPSGGAGIIADSRVLQYYGLYATGVITAITAQNTKGVNKVFPLFAGEVKAQLGAVLDDMRPIATKIGMLASGTVAETVTRFMRDGRLGKVVFDPVLESTDGYPLADDKLVGRIPGILETGCDLVTPNIGEAEKLTGLRIDTLDDARRAGEMLAGMGAAAVCVTGGHWRNSPEDILVDENGTEIISGKRMAAGENVHGTGCFFSAAVTACLALGRQPREAIIEAKKLMERAIAGRAKPGGGMSIPWLAD